MLWGVFRELGAAGGVEEVVHANVRRSVADEIDAVLSIHANRYGGNNDALTGSFNEQL